MSGRVLTRWLSAFWKDERGFVLSAELVIISTILVIGLVTGLNCLRTSVTGELEDVGSAIGSLNQSYWYRGFSGRSHGPCGVKSQTVGSIFVDRGDGGIDAPADVSGEVDALFQRQRGGLESDRGRRVIVPSETEPRIIVPTPEVETPRIIVPSEPLDPSAVPIPCPPGMIPGTVPGSSNGRPCDCVPSSGASAPRTIRRIVPSSEHPVVPHSVVPHEVVPHEVVPHGVVPKGAVPQSSVPQDAVPVESVPKITVPAVSPPASDSEKRPPRKSLPPQPE